MSKIITGVVKTSHTSQVSSSSTLHCGVNYTYLLLSFLYPVSPACDKHPKTVLSTKPSPLLCTAMFRAVKGGWGGAPQEGLSSLRPQGEDSQTFAVAGNNCTTPPARVEICLTRRRLRPSNPYTVAGNDSVALIVRAEVSLS